MRHSKLTIIGILSMICCFGQSGSKQYSLSEISISISVPTDLKLIDITPKPEYLDSNWNVITDTSQIRQLKSTDTNTLLELSTKDRKEGISIVKTPFHTDLVPFMGQPSDGFRNFKETAVKARVSMGDICDTTSARIIIAGLPFEKFYLRTKDSHTSLWIGTYLALINNFYILITFKCENDLTARRIQSIIENAKSN